MAKDLSKERQLASLDYSRYDFKTGTESYEVILNKGLSERTVKEISAIKNEPQWMLEYRLKALKAFEAKPMPQWGADLNGIKFNDIVYYMRASEANREKWEDVPEYIKNTFDRLGLPDAEKKFLGGVGAQYDSEIVYHSIRKDLEKLGVLFLSMDQGLLEYPEIVKAHFGKTIPYSDNKFAALNSAVWSGGSFVFVPKGVKVEIPLQAYFRINAENMGQFERTLIVAEPESQIHYVEGCTAPKYSSQALHSAVVEVVAKDSAHVRYTTIQNWSNNIYNLVTKRAVAHKNATVEWVDGNLGSKVTQKYPSVYLMEEGAKAEILSVALASKGQRQDAGGKVVHLASNTTSTITSKSVSKDGGRATYRGLLKVFKGAKNVTSHVQCDALMLDPASRSDTYPTIEVDEPTADIGHEATVGKIGEDQIFYLMSRGLKEEEARTMIVMGFIREFTRSLPMEYAVELNRLIELEMENSVG